MLNRNIWFEKQQKNIKIKWQIKKNHHESLNVEEALSVSEAFIVKHKTAIIGFVAGVIILVAGALAYKHLYAEPREEKAQAAIFKGQEYFEQDAYDMAL
ncbi:MAG: hypothetical protein LRY34_05040, partial [Bacteroides graminisolvens]|nr:hypothetical protein [Bacteroides graminisolvens]